MPPRGTVALGSWVVPGPVSGWVFNGVDAGAAPPTLKGTVGAGAGAPPPIVPPAVLNATVGAGAGAEGLGGPAGAVAVGGLGAKGALGATGAAGAGGAAGAEGAEGAAGASEAFRVTRTVSFFKGTAEVLVIGLGGFGASSLIVCDVWLRTFPVLGADRDRS